MLLIWKFCCNNNSVSIYRNIIMIHTTHILPILEINKKLMNKFYFRIKVILLCYFKAIIYLLN